MWLIVFLLGPCVCLCDTRAVRGGVSDDRNRPGQTSLFFLLQILFINLHFLELLDLSDHFCLLLFLSVTLSTRWVRLHTSLAVAVAAFVEPLAVKHLDDTDRSQTQGKGSTIITQALIPPQTHFLRIPSKKGVPLAWRTPCPKQPNHIPRPTWTLHGRQGR